jgi:hypothetical protein
MQMHPVRDPNHQLLAVGYEPVGGLLRCRWGKGEGEYAGVPENVFVSIRKVPYAYGYLQKVVRGKYPYTKIEDPPAKPVPPDVIYHERESYYTTENRELDRAWRVSIATDDRQDKRTERKQVEQERNRTMEVFFPQDGMTFHEADHHYELNGQRIPFSLTQILSISGLARQPGSAQEAAAWTEKAKFGTKVHEYSHWLDQGEMELNDLAKYPAYFNSVLGWKQFRDDFSFQPDLTLCEVPVGVKVNGMLYATKVDAYGVIGEGDNLAMAVVEKKTTCNIEPHFALQTAGEALAFKAHAESLQMPLKRFLVQLLPEPNGGGKCYKVQEHTDRNDEKVFVGAGLMNVYQRLNYGTLKAGA